MAILSGALTARRFRVVGQPPSDWRDVYRERLVSMAFREAPTRTGKEEVEGWVEVGNLLDTTFEDPNQWRLDTYMMFALRVDKKTLPAKLFRATVDKKCRDWCAENEVEKCPASMKKEIKEELETEWLRRALPRVAVSEICWHVTEGWLVVGSLSETTVERVRKRFHRTFALELHPWSPLDHLADAGLAESLLASAPANLGGEA